MRERIEDRERIKWSIKKRMLAETGGRCAHCGTVLIKGENLTLEHFIPLDKGGTNEEENFTVLCYDCNQLKSNMILPVSWYPHLSATKRNTFKTLIRKYLREVDYLAENCTMMVDTFRIRVFIPIQGKIGGNGYRTLGMPVNIDGLRMTQYDAFNWLIEYKTSLEWQDACGTISQPSEWNAPCYLLKKADKDIAMVCPWIVHEWNEEIGNYYNSIIFDWYFSPDLPDKDYIPKMLADIMKMVETNVMGDLANTTDGTAIVLSRFRCFLSDRFGGPAFDALERVSGVSEYEAENGMTARIREVMAFQHVGKSAEKLYKETAGELEAAAMEGGLLPAMKIAMQHCDAFNKRFKHKNNAQ